MKWWKGLLGLERDGLETKEIIGSGALGAWAGVSRHDGVNFRTNQVTLAQYQDSGTGNVLGLSATWACVNLIAGTIASLPMGVYRTVAGVREIARDHPLYYVLHDSPNFDQTALDFWEFMAAALELQGNAYAQIERRGNGSAYSLIPIQPDLVTARRRGSGFIEYEWTIDGRKITKDVGEVLHIRGPMGDALSGVSTLTACRAAFTGAMSAETAARSTFRNGLSTGGYFATRPEDTLTKEQREGFNEILAQNYQGAVNAGRPMLLDRGLTFHQLSITPEDAQMLDSRKFSGEEICRIFGVPPAMVGFGDKSSNWGTGKEVDVLGFIKFTLRRRLKRIEQALQKQLLTPADKAEGISIEFNMEGLLRGDSAGRSAFYTSMTLMGAMTINEVRVLENLPPVAGGDVPRMQMQNVPITEAGGDLPAGDSE